MTGAVACASTLGVTGAVACASTLGVTGAVACASTLGVTGAVACASTLGVTGMSTLTGAVACSSTLDVTGAVACSSTLGVTGAVACSSTLGVTGVSTLTGAVACSSTLDVTGDVTLFGLLKGPSTFVIDPSGHGDNTGTVVIKGSLTVEGTTTTVNSTEITIVDKNITIAKGNTVLATADGAGLNIELTSSSDVASILYKYQDDNFLVNKIVRCEVSPTTDTDLTNKLYVDQTVAASGSLITDNSIDFDKLKGIKFKIISSTTTFTDIDISVPSILYVLNKHNSSVNVIIGETTLAANTGFNMFVFDPTEPGWSSSV